MVETPLPTRLWLILPAPCEPDYEKSTPSGVSQREPDCGLWTLDYARGIIPTIVWEIGHTQRQSSLLRRAKMWARRYDGRVQAILLLKYTCRDPRLNPSSYLLLFRPRLRADGKWTAVQDGPTYVLFPRPANVVPDDLTQQGDAVPLTYQDYFGPGNVVAGARTDPLTRFDLPLELVRMHITDAIQAANNRKGYRFVSGGSSVGEPGELGEPIVVGEPADAQAQNVEVVDQQVEVQPDREVSPDEDERPGADSEFGMFGQDWDEAMSDVSDS